MVQSRHFEMALSREEFLRLLPKAVPTPFAEGPEGTFRPADGAARWTLRLVPLAPLHLGGLDLPRHRVELGLEGLDEPAAEAFLARFHRGFQRGGG
jgi:hypothetical protein